MTLKGVGTKVPASFFDANYVIDKRNERVYDNKEFTFTKEVDYEGCNLR